MQPNPDVRSAGSKYRNLRGGLKATSILVQPTEKGRVATYFLCFLGRKIVYSKLPISYPLLCKYGHQLLWTPILQVVLELTYFWWPLAAPFGFGEWFFCIRISHVEKVCFLRDQFSKAWATSEVHKYGYTEGSEWKWQWQPAGGQSYLFWV